MYKSKAVKNGQKCDSKDLGKSMGNVNVLYLCMSDKLLSQVHLKCNCKVSCSPLGKTGESLR